MRSNKEIEADIILKIEKIRPYLHSEGGDCEFIKFDFGTAYIKMVGACEGCSNVEYTIKEGIEALLMEEVPEVVEVVNVNDYE